ncbi:MAG: hypothetical protein A3B89_03995 [Candidatus Buchananbacteria bacterium RIFCSPHIGHO2_02_FULL_40_13]|uniref:Glycosyltransferase 2-like domain-containing protein n=1 Tax=Candidatus Buchananbacteria bacterium RIFCSPLOWO2_01_FULL_39_33 TaxID=1797543 RepID=A0A1G1YK41_9BACT|nr:MAG: hypothetical protein A2820_02595 [Candidatus Buchananbacteria bacterium RIFCSPHIGHO2_01_FULL_40_35]OGY50720.1 MAG: hypothetical protein A3B89_03995 [Candidatus Buchananbacteria bacterium RIFCSPHIGHO2_02_FULL_40_13]OGY52651.1 MAG: hypothetical protein A3A02_03970 [Candidatus Buchananbacteria bacterium RIFCSPLOWO2_01_FULL_39_33]
MTKISVIIPVYNAQKTINQCLRSIFNQTFKDFEVIVVNDGSTDSSWSILESWQDKIKIFNQENKGAPAARNFGFEKSSGEYIIFCDADIIMKPTMLEKMSWVLDKDKDLAYVYSSFKFGWKTFKLWPFDLAKLKQMPYIPTTSLIRRNYFSGFDQSLKKFQDWDLWLTISEKGGKGIWLNEILFLAVSGGTMSNWFPKIFFYLPLQPKKIKKEIEKFNSAKEIIKNKHGI